MFVALILIVALFVVCASLQRWRKLSDDDGIEEVREGLDGRSLLSERWREWWNRRKGRKRTALSLEPLDPGSARAHYREMLQAIATNHNELARTQSETPLEYEVKLLAYLEEGTTHSQKLPGNGDGASESTHLSELTDAYVIERYGGKQIDAHQRARLRTWVPALIARLTRRASSPN